MDELSESRPPPSDTIAGEFVTEIFDYDDGRQVIVYVPSARPEAIVFASDGQLISPWGRLLEGADVPRSLGYIASPTRHCGSTSILLGLIRNGSQLTRSFSSRILVPGCARVSAYRSHQNARPCSVFRRVENWQLRWGFDTRNATARFSQPLLAGAISRQTQCRAGCREHT